MAEEPATPDLIALSKRAIDAVNEGDLDGGLRQYSPGAVYDLSSVGMGILEGHAAMRAFWEEWIAAYDEFNVEFEEINDLGELTPEGD